MIAAAGASLVQWNRLNGNILASAHDSDVRIWDMRVWDMRVWDMRVWDMRVWDMRVCE